MRFTAVFFVSCLLFSCNSTPLEEQILGAWKVDSTYTYYNGFGFTDKAKGQDWATLLYEANGNVKEVKFSTYRQHQYEFIGKDSLVFTDGQGNVVSSFKVLKLDDQQLRLHKSKLPIFAGANQKRYEIRYFSRTNHPTNLDAYQAVEPKYQTE